MTDRRSNTDRLPPHAPEAEQGVLGCALLSPDVVMAALLQQRFTVHAFYELRHQIIFAALLRLYNAHVPVDIISLHQTLKDGGSLEEIGGMAYLNELQDRPPSAANLDYYADVVKEKYRLRTLVSFCTSAVARAYECEGQAEDLLAGLESELEQLCAPLQTVAERHIKTVLHDEVLPLLERHYNRGKTQLDGLPTGLTYLDKVLLGIAPTDYVVLAGRPGEGKTSLALNIVDHLASKYVWWREVNAAEAGTLTDVTLDEEQQKHFQRMVGLPVAVFTLEMTEDSLGMRLVFSHAQVSSGSFRQGFASKADFTGVNKAVVELSATNIYLDGEADQTMDMIAAKARRMVRQYGIKLFVLDYLQLLDSDEDSDRLRVLRRISKKIISLKKRLKVPWLVLAQMNRNIETAERARRPVMSDLKESGSIEQDADKIIFLYHPLKGEGIEEDETMIAAHWTGSDVDMPRRINALVAKNRNGPTGPAALLFQNNQCQFQDWHEWQVKNGLVTPAAGESNKQTERPTNGATLHGDSCAGGRGGETGRNRD